MTVNRTSKEKVVVFFLYLFLVFFFLGFYLTGIPSSKHSSGIRAGVLVLIILFFFFMRRSNFFRRLVEGYRHLAAEFKVFIVLFLCLFLFYFARSCLAFDFAEARRIAVIFLFIVVLSWGLSYTRVSLKNICYYLGVLGFFAGSMYFINNFILGEYKVLIKPIRVADSGSEFFLDYGNTIIAGLFLAYLLIASVWSYLNVKSNWVALFYYLSSVLLVFAVFNTAARTAWIASIVSLIVLFVYYKNKTIKKIAVLYSPLFLLGVSYLVFNFTDGVVRKGLTYRDKIWIEHLQAINSWKEWLFGKGLSANMKFVELPGGKLAAHSHSVYIELLYTGGVVGLLLFLLMLYMLFYNLIKVSRSNIESSFCLSVLSGGAVSMAFDFSDVFYTPNLIWLWLWSIVAIAVSHILTVANRNY